MRSHRTLAALVTLAAVVACTLASPLSDVTTVRADDPTWGDVVPGEYVILVTPDADLAAIAQAIGATAPAERLTTESRYVRLVLDPTLDPAATVDALLNTPGVERAQPNLVTSSSDFLGARRKFFTDLPPATTNVAASRYRIGQPGLRGAGLPSRTTATSVTVAVLDTGVDTKHPKLVRRIKSGGYDFVDLDSSPAEATNGLDDNGNGFVDEAFGHGTYVAGIIALVAPGAKVLPIRVLDSDGTGSTWTVMEGLALAAAKRVHIVNLSLGGPVAGPVADHQLAVIVAAGVAIVAAAGNDTTTEPVHPAGSDGVVGVTSYDASTLRVASFANTGSWIDVAAPGVAIVSTYPGGRYASWGGSSSSAPVVAAALALIERQQPGAEVDDLVSFLTSTARPDGLDNVSAHGRIDVGAAVRLARTS